MLAGALVTFAVASARVSLANGKAEQAAWTSRWCSGGGGSREVDVGVVAGAVERRLAGAGAVGAGVAVAPWLRVTVPAAGGVEGHERAAGLPAL